MNRKLTISFSANKHHLFIIACIRSLYSVSKDKKSELPRMAATLFLTAFAMQDMNF